jgi:hypothetical protein
MDLERECKVIGADGVQGSFTSDEDDHEEPEVDNNFSEGSPVGKLSNDTTLT